MEGQTTSETLFYVLFSVLVFFLVVLFFAKLKFGKTFEKREDRRRMLLYSKVKLSPNSDGQKRALRIKQVGN